MDYFIREDHSGKKQHVGIVVWMYLIVLLENYALVWNDNGFEFFFLFKILEHGMFRNYGEKDIFFLGLSCRGVGSICKSRGLSKA